MSFEILNDMKIIFDGYWWNRGPFSNRTVLVNLINEWGRLFPEDQLTVVVPGKKYSRKNISKIELIELPWLPHPLFNLIYIWSLSLNKNYDYVLVQNFGIFSSKSLVFIHDVIFLSRKDWFSWIENIYFSFIPRIAKAKRVQIITSSKTESRRIETFIRNKKVTSVGLGVRLSLTEAESKRPPSLLDTLGKFYFTVGRDNPRKNLRRLIEAHTLMIKEKSDAPILVIVGLTLKQLRNLGIENESKSSIVLLANISDSELRWLYENGQFYVYLSLDEGYGLPIIEADYFNIPQLISDIQVFREISQKDVVFANPLSVENIKFNLIELSKKHRNNLSENQKINNSWTPVIHEIRLCFQNRSSKF